MNGEKKSSELLSSVSSRPAIRLSECGIGFYNSRVVGGDSRATKKTICDSKSGNANSNYTYYEVHGNLLLLVSTVLRH